jgi:hypothetical protein
MRYARKSKNYKCLFFFWHRMIFYHALRTHHLDTCKTMVLQHVKQRGIMPPFEVAPCVLLPLNKERKSVMSEFEEKQSKGPLKLSHEGVHKCQRSVSEWFLTGRTIHATSNAHVRPVLCFKNLQIYFSREIRFSSFFSSFVLPKTREKKSRDFFSRDFLGLTSQKKNVKLISRFFSIFSFLEFFLLSFTYKKSRDFLCTEFLELFSLPKKHRCTQHYACRAAMNTFDFEEENQRVSMVTLNFIYYLCYWLNQQ